MKNPFEKFFGTKKEEDGGPGGAPLTKGAEKAPPVMTQPKMTQEEKNEYEKTHPEEVYKPGDIGAYAYENKNNDEGFIDGEIRKEEEITAQSNLMDKIAEREATKAKQVEELKKNIQNDLAA